jgi:very-short-patch-repair endonuclease
MGWTVIRLWQHDLERDFEGSIGEIVSALEKEPVD